MSRFHGRCDNLVNWYFNQEFCTKRHWKKKIKDYNVSSSTRIYVPWRQRPSLFWSLLYSLCLGSCSVQRTCSRRSLEWHEGMGVSQTGKVLKAIKVTQVPCFFLCHCIFFTREVDVEKERRRLINDKPLNARGPFIFEFQSIIPLVLLALRLVICLPQRISNKFKPQKSHLLWSY